MIKINYIKGIILCEGETDQALIGAFLENNNRWQYLGRNADILPNEEIQWYADEKEGFYGIWQVGGNNFNKAVNKMMDIEHKASIIDNIAIITDNDDNDAQNVRVQELVDIIYNVLGINIQYQEVINQWYPVLYTNAFSDRAKFNFSYILVPLDEHGALETFMMNALSEQSKEKSSVILQSKDFIKKFVSDIYLKKRRDRIKAELGVSLAIFSPDRIFTTMKELIASVDWANLDTANKQFELLKQI